MGFLFEKCTFAVLDEDTIKECDPFSCGHQDLDDFFHNDAPLYNAQLLGKSYCFRSDKKPSDIVCAFTVSNDSIRVNILPNSREKKVQKDIPRAKQMHRYPGVLIGRLGINKEYKHQDGVFFAFGGFAVVEVVIGITDFDIEREFAELSVGQFEGVEHRGNLGVADIADAVAQNYQ